MSAVDVLAVRVITPHKKKTMKAMLRNQRLDIVKSIDILRGWIALGATWERDDLCRLIRMRRETMRQFRRELNACVVQKYSNISPAAKARALAASGGAK